MESHQWMAVAILSIVFIGCTGNILSFTIFSRPHMRSSSVNVLLCALSFVDFSLLLFSVPTFAIPGLDLWQTQEEAVAFLAYVLKWIYPVNLTMQTCSIYIMCTITMERWFAVCRPLQVRMWCTPRKSRLALLVIFIFSVSYNVVRFFEYKIVRTEEGNVEYSRLLRDQQEYPWYVIGYYTVLYLLTHFLLPFSLMAVMNGSVILSMWRLRRARLMLTRQQQREQSTTVMLLIVTFVFAACNTLPFLLNVAECIYPSLFSDPKTAGLAYQLNDLSTVLVVLNSATTFLVYLLFSEKYRHTLLFLLRRGCCASSSDYNAYNAMSRTASMRVCSFTQNNTDHKLSTASRAEDALLKPLCSAKRSERSMSEYNQRTAKPEQLARSQPTHASEKKRPKTVTMEDTSPTRRLSPPRILITASDSTEQVSDSEQNTDNGSSR